MSTTMDHWIETVDRVSLAVAGRSVQGADVKSMPASPNGLAGELLEEPAALAAEKVRREGLRPMGEGGPLPEPAQHLMQAAWRPTWTSTCPPRPAGPAGPGPARAATCATATGLTFATEAHNIRGSVSDAAIAAARQAHVTDEQFLEILALVSINTFTNCTCFAHTDLGFRAVV